MIVKCGFCGEETDLGSNYDDSTYICQYCQRENNLEEMNKRESVDPKVYMSYFQQKQKIIGIGSRILLLIFILDYTLRVWQWALRSDEANETYAIGAAMIAFPVLYLIIFFIHYNIAMKQGDVDLCDLVLTIIIWIIKGFMEFVAFSSLTFIISMLIFGGFVLLLAYMDHIWTQKKIFDGIPQLKPSEKETRRLRRNLWLNIIGMVGLVVAGSVIVYMAEAGI